MDASLLGTCVGWAMEVKGKGWIVCRGYGNGHEFRVHSLGHSDRMHIVFDHDSVSFRVMAYSSQHLRSATLMAEGTLAGNPLDDVGLTPVYYFDDLDALGDKFFGIDIYYFVDGKWRRRLRDRRAYAQHGLLPEI